MARANAALPARVEPGATTTRVRCGYCPTERTGAHPHEGHHSPTPESAGVADGVRASARSPDLKQVRSGLLHVGVVTMPQPRRGQRRPSNWDSDPLLKGADWEAIKVHWRRQRLPCARCGRPIDYDTTPRYWRSLDVGHIVDRAQAKDQGWSRAQINSVDNTQPEHQRCSREAGVRLGNARRRAAPRSTRAGASSSTRLSTRVEGRRPIEADEW